MINTGDVFLAMLSTQEPKRHFWVVILAVNKINKTVCVNITSVTKDRTLKIYSGEYTELTQSVSYANFPQARIEDIDNLEEKIRKNIIKKKTPVPSPLLKQMQESALLSKYTPGKIKAFIREHTKLNV